ncbi:MULTISPECIES: hypothetical protein [Streptosporangium]|uniref:Rhomboid family intramembrane serine protease n=1 Tax=Streptosporangium brasiliense TaxID=47480 RepID=A0ABT9RE62_9ACTN|nr:hypothetical protein [Streptosporangium brasiliense]MDP9867542.1 hypothetical protein [Streptosporangium brasiliense]
MAAMDRAARIGRREARWQVDFRASDRRERRIMRQMTAGLALGMLLALTGGSLARALPDDVVRAYDPYLYGVLVLDMTRGSPQAGWAALNGALASAGLTAGHLTAQALDHAESLLSQSGGWTTALGVTIVAFGLAGHLSRRPDAGGDIAVGLLSGLLLFSLVAQQAAGPPHGAPQSGPWAPLALAALGLSLPFLLRPTAAARTRTALTALTCAAASSAALFALPLLLGPL